MFSKSLKKPTIGYSIAMLLLITVTLTANSMSYGFMGFNLGGSDTSQDSSITSTQSSSQGSYCYAPPNATIINSCNSGDLSTSQNTGLNLLGQ
ncbi:MAG TPA: hypothetical protein VFG45_04325 [Candidatus Nitrosocosmicus sp.]|nr:hypothetical protein [Candidatus Nitrosocosmicus sp.]